jgi:hypothetical protein
LRENVYFTDKAQTQAKPAAPHEANEGCVSNKAEI